MVSCADTLAVAAREWVVTIGGPSWDLLLDRRDSLAPIASSTIELPNPDSPCRSQEKVRRQGLHGGKYGGFVWHPHHREVELLFLPRSHLQRRQHGPGVRDQAVDHLSICPPVGDDLKVAPFNPQSPNMFNNAYYDNLVEQKGLFRSDQALFGDGDGNAV
ncbi:hypothetical protein ACFX2C_033086 [Malus domestica]